MNAAVVLDDPLVRDFESGALDAAAFGHREHLYVAWCYLRALPFELAAPRFVQRLRAFAARHGAPGKFHATVTWAYLALLAEALATPALRDLSFDELTARRPDLLDHRGGALRARYTDAELASALARECFVLPGGGAPA